MNYRDWDLEYDGAVPLPKKIFERRGSWAWKIRRLLPAGAYFIRLAPRNARHRGPRLPREFAGVLRIHYEGSRLWGRPVTSGSADIYRTDAEDVISRMADVPGDQCLQKLVFPIGDYRYYLALASTWVTKEHQVILGFDTYLYVDCERDPGAGWRQRQKITLQIGGSEDPSETPGSPEDPSEAPLDALEVGDGNRLNGKLLNSRGTVIANVELVRVSRTLRHAVVRAHAAKDLNVPGLGDERAYWTTALRKACWSVEIQESEAIPDGEPWTDPRNNPPPEERFWRPDQLRMYHRQYLQSDEEPDSWTYHLLIVDHIKDGKSRPAGKMYDVDDAQPRQGAAIAARKRGKWRVRPVPAAERELQEAERVFNRTAIHELGHMQGLYHNPHEPCIMQQSRDVKSLNHKLLMRHSEADAFRLRHLPDLWVRPGGLPFGYRYRPSAFHILDQLGPPDEGLEMTLSVPSVELGEGIREVELGIWNNGRRDAACPYKATPRNLGLLLLSPSGRQWELWAVPVPDKLGASVNLRQHECWTYRIEPLLNRKWPVLREVGTYQLAAYMLWYLDLKRGVGDYHRVEKKDGFDVSSVPETHGNNATNHGEQS